MSEAFTQYCALQERLIAMIESGNDGPEADALRDEMDEPWYKLTDEEIGEVRRIGAQIAERYSKR